MKRCLACGALYPAVSMACGACGAAPAIERGFPAYAPALARQTDGFEAAFFTELSRVEERHFWFRQRSRLIVHALRRYCPSLGSFLEIGCGTGQVLAEVARAFPGARLLGSEILSEGLCHAARRLPGAELLQMDARRLPYADEFDAIGAFDVLEHIDEDTVVLDEIRGALKPGGTLVVTVPQHRWLWSATDAYSRHFRRYDAAALHAKLLNAGFRILRSTSFVSFLLPAVLLSRALDRKGGQERERRVESDIPDWMNRVFNAIQGLEVALITRGIDMPIGSSRLVVAVRT